MKEIIIATLLKKILKRDVKILSIKEQKCQIINSISFENKIIGVSYCYLYGNEEIRFIPLSELISLCKLWCENQTIKKLEYGCISYLSSGVFKNKGIATIHFGGADFDYFADTEAEAVFLACEYVLSILL